MSVLAINLTESRIALPLGDYLDCINWVGRPTYCEWHHSLDFINGGKEMSSSVHSLLSVPACRCNCDQPLQVPEAFDSPAIMDCTVELKGEMNPFSFELLCFHISRGRN